VQMLILSTMYLIHTCEDERIINFARSIGQLVLSIETNELS
jgi:hypothetical protein